MTNKIQCATHGESDKTYVCEHLIGETSGLGFNRENPSDDDPFPDAWCDNCEVIRAAHDGWTDEAQELVKIELLCSECYERARIRNTRPSVGLDDLAGLRWKCGHCERWHTGPILDIAFKEPDYWPDSYEANSPWQVLTNGVIEKTCKSFLCRNYCAIDDRDFFVRGMIHLPIIGAAETFRWGVWGSLSRESFETFLRTENDPNRIEISPAFSWLSSQIPEYPDTLNLKMYAHVQEPGVCPYFRLEKSNHPLAQEYHHGISPERVKEIMLKRLPAVEQ